MYPPKTGCDKDYDNHLLNYILHHRRSDNIVSIARNSEFGIASHTLSLGRSEFCLEKNKASLGKATKGKETQLNNKGDTYNVKIKDLQKLIEDDAMWKRKLVKTRLLRLIEDIPAWNAFPWGEYYCAKFYKKDEKLIDKHKEDHMMFKKTILLLYQCTHVTDRERERERARFEVKKDTDSSSGGARVEETKSKSTSVSDDIDEFDVATDDNAKEEPSDAANDIKHMDVNEPLKVCLKKDVNVSTTSSSAADEEDVQALENTIKENVSFKPKAKNISTEKIDYKYKRKKLCNHKRTSSTAIKRHSKRHIKDVVSTGDIKEVVTKTQLLDSYEVWGNLIWTGVYNVLISEPVLKHGVPCRFRGDHAMDVTPPDRAITAQ
uniref:Phospholipase-like protein n=1 Tax=Tanacetum cinerariifolium TaxID=118510 RepID=A0A699GTE9_TANCI|nr:hypothetical protein [Tanacetum cinerariifolium]